MLRDGEMSGHSHFSSLSQKSSEFDMYIIYSLNWTVVDAIQENKWRVNHNEWPTSEA
jgi:hypothetical protein